MRIFHRCLRSTCPELPLSIGGRERQKPGAFATAPQRKGRHYGFATATTYLLVEDDEDTLSATTAMIERLGFSVTDERIHVYGVRSIVPQRIDMYRNAG
jgi:hypothetical protein